MYILLNKLVQLLDMTCLNKHCAALHYTALRSTALYCITRLHGWEKVSRKRLPMYGFTVMS